MSALSSDSGRKRSCHEGKTPVGGLAGSKLETQTHNTTAVLSDTDFVDNIWLLLRALSKIQRLELDQVNPDSRTFEEYLSDKN